MIISKAKFICNIQLSSYFLLKSFEKDIWHVSHFTRIHKTEFFVFAILCPSVTTVFQLYDCIYFTIYWLFLGVLSSIGLGTGLHTGTLYLLPYIIESSRSYSNFLPLLFNTFPASFLWSIGTALGELPPYLFFNNQINTDNYWIKKFINFEGNEIRIKTKICNLNIKQYILQNAFILIVLFSSYPNMLFDMCGILCGYLKIPFTTFITGTIIGKAFIKTPIQLAIICLILTNKISFLSLDFMKTNNGNIQTYWLYITFGFTFYFIANLLIDKSYTEYKIQHNKFK